MSQFSWCSHSQARLLSILRGRAQAAASVTGSEDYPQIAGAVRFYQTAQGVIVFAEIYGLPHDDFACHDRVFGFHIHTGSNCGSAHDSFAAAMSHYDPDSCAHPYHAGDLPPLFGNGPFALSVFLTGRFTVDEVIGRTVIIHDHPDDFTTQPSGNSGTRIACGVIRRTTGPFL